MASALQRSKYSPHQGERQKEASRFSLARTTQEESLRPRKDALPGIPLLAFPQTSLEGAGQRSVGPQPSSTRPLSESQCAEAHRLSAAWWPSSSKEGKYLDSLATCPRALLRNKITQKKTETQDRVRGACAWTVLVCALSET